jgi:trk system potassium uptake protein
MKALIAGAGRLGTQSARALSDNGYDVTIVEQNVGRLADLAEIATLSGQSFGRVVAGDACEPTVLEEAGALTVDLLVAATGDDEDNLVISLLAKRQFAVDHVVARVNDMDNAWLFDGRWGVDVMVPAAMPLISLIEEAAGSADTVALVRLSRAGVGVIETALTEHSRATGTAVRDIELPSDAIVAAVIRAGRPRIPDPSLLLQAGDELLIVSSSATADDVHKAFQ